MTGLGALEAAAAVLTTVVVFLRWVWPRVARFADKVDASMTAIVGHDDIKDRANGRVISGARPGIGVWMATTDDSIATLSTAVQALVEQYTQFDPITSRLTELSESSLDHERRIVRLEERAAIEGPPLPGC